MPTHLRPVRRLATLVLAVLGTGLPLLGQKEDPTKLIRQLLDISESDQIAYLTNYISEGAPKGNDAVVVMVMSKASLFAPMLERKIEEIVQSPTPERLFRDQSVDPQEVVTQLAWMIVATRQKIALEQASKLMKIGEDRFGDLVLAFLDNVVLHRSGLDLAYQCFEIGDPAVEKRIIAWFDEGLGQEPDRTRILYEWTPTLVRKYNGAPDESQWARDPIASRLSPNRLNPSDRPPLHDEIALRIKEAETPTDRLMRSSEAKQIAYLNDDIAEGFPRGTSTVEVLVPSKPSVFVPLIEQKIEGIVQSPAPESLFKNSSVDPKRVVDQLTFLITYHAGGKVALEQASKLIKIDEDRFGPMVPWCLTYTNAHGNVFPLAYRGFEIGDAAVNKRIVSWVGSLLGQENASEHAKILQQWAEAMVDEYNGVPDENQWASDPILSRLGADQLNPIDRPSIHDEMLRLTAETVQKRPKE